MKRYLRAEVVLLVLLFGLFIVPGVTGTLEPEIEETNRITYNTGENKRRTIFDSSSKALGDPASTNKYAWSDNGDGNLMLVGGVPVAWSTTDNYVAIGDFSGNSYESFLSFAIGTTFQSSSIIKSIDTVEINVKCLSKNNLEGSEVVEFREMDTNNQCGAGGDSDCNSFTEVFEMDRSASDFDVDTSEFDVGVWEDLDITAMSWLEIGDNGQINFYLEEDGFATNEYLTLATSDSSDNPYLSVDYTLWSAPTANSVDITNEPTTLLPGQNYEVQTVVSDTDGYTNVNSAYLYLSADHTTNRVRFDWSRSTNIFSTGEGAGYCGLNTTASNSSNDAVNTITLWWHFNVTADWTQGYMDWANQAIDAQSKSTMNWNDQNTWYTDRLWLYDLDVEWIAETTYLEDGDYVQTSEILNITGYFYWNLLTIVYDLSFGTPIVDLINGTIDSGAIYNDTIDALGYFEIAYTTPATEDWTWSLDVTLDIANLPTGLTEGTSNDNGKDPLFLVNTSPTTTFGSSGDTVTILVQPNTIVPQRITGHFDEAFDVLTGGFRTMETDDGARSAWSHTDRSDIYLEIEWSPHGYWNQADAITYDIDITSANAAGRTAYIYDYAPAQVNIASGNPIIGTHDVANNNWNDGRLQVRVAGHQDVSGWIYINIDQLTLNFSSVSDTYLCERVLNGTAVYDIIEFESKHHDTNFTITGIPTTYTYIDIMGGEADVTDNIVGGGSIIVSDTGVGHYEIWLDTNMTWHEVGFSVTLPDGLSIDWQVFEWYANTTHFNQMPYPLNEGYYEILVQDGFDNEIIATNITIDAADDLNLMYGFDTLGMMPLYELTVPNNDQEQYYIGLERNDKTSYFPLAPMSETQGIRVYGTEAGTNYTMTVYKSSDDSVIREYTLSMPDNAFVHEPIDEQDNDMDIDIYSFRTDNTHWYVDISTRSEGATIDILENDVLIFNDYSEDTEFVYIKKTDIGKHTVDVIVEKTGYDTKVYNSSYYITDTTLYILELSPPSQSAEANMSMIIRTSWGNCTISFDEYSYDPSTNDWNTEIHHSYSGIPEGAISWGADFSSSSVRMIMTIDGGAQELERTFYYSKAYQDVNVNVGSAPPIIVPGDITKMTRAQVFWQNFPYYVILGVGFLMFGIFMTKSEKSPYVKRQTRQKEKESKHQRNIPQNMRTNNKSMTESYRRF